VVVCCFIGRCLVVVSLLFGRFLILFVGCLAVIWCCLVLYGRLFGGCFAVV